MAPSSRDSNSDGDASSASQSSSGNSSGPLSGGSSGSSSGSSEGSSSSGSSESSSHGSASDSDRSDDTGKPEVLDRRQGGSGQTLRHGSGAAGLLIWEVCCSPMSLITAAALLLGMSAERKTLETGLDARCHAHGRKACDDAKRRGVNRVWLALPCTAWSCMQNLNRRSRKQVRKLEKKRRESVRMLRICLRILRVITLANHGEFYFEWPSNCQGWRLPVLQQFFDEVRRAGRQVYKIRIDGCAYDMKSRNNTAFLLKRWTVMTTDVVMQQKLGRTCPKTHCHVVIQGSETAASAYYPPRMAATVAHVWAAAD